MRFNYRIIRLNHLRWQDYAQQRNPVASAFMSKMRMKRQDRPDAKLACLQSLTQLNLNSAQIQLLSGFVDTYLKLDSVENERFLEQLDKIEPRQQESVMQIVTSWMEEGIQQGLQQGQQREALSLVTKQLRRKIRELTPEAEQAIAQLSLSQLEDLAEALLDFTASEDLTRWLQQHSVTSVSQP